MTIRVLKTFVGCDDGSVELVDTIEHEGGVWLVPGWLDSPDGRQTRPARIVRLDVLPHEKAKVGSADYVLSGPMPKAVLDCSQQISREQARPFVVVDLPNIVMPNPRRLN